MDDIDLRVNPIAINADLKNLTLEETIALIKRLEKITDEELAQKIMPEEAACDCYFGLAYVAYSNCLDEEKNRFLAKANNGKYNPFKSSNPNIVFLARHWWMEGETGEII